MESLLDWRHSFFSRRNALRFAAGMSALAPASAAPERPEEAGTHRGPVQLASDYTVVTSVTPGERFIHDPGMTLLPSGRVLVAAPRWQLKGNERSVLIARSSDGGRRWRPLASLPYHDATPFVVNHSLYMFVQPQNWKDVYFTRSEDEGETWANPVKIFEGSYWNTSTGMVTTKDHLYWALDADNWASTVAISADLSKDLLHPSAWRMSNAVRRPETPQTLRRNLFPPASARWTHQWKGDTWLEPNVVRVNGRIRVILRMIVDEYATANLAAVCDLHDDGERLHLSFGQFDPLPGGQNKFFILYDPVSPLFWMLSNLVTDSQDVFNNHDALIATGYLGGTGNERRFLMLSYSVDASNWFSAGCVARGTNILQSFMYPSASVSGPDLILTSRTSRNGHNQHDADLVTFHRVKNFRSLAMNLSL
jgi:hypothetical protein